MTPTGYSTVCPYLMVKEIEPQMEFLKTVFDAIVKEELKTPDGIIQHGELRIGETVIMFGRGSAEFPSQTSMNYVFVKSADEIYAKAITAGAKKVVEPVDRFYGIREAGFTDFNGNTWWIAQPIKPVSVEEMEKGFAEAKKAR